MCSSDIQVVRAVLTNLRPQKRDKSQELSNFRAGCRIYLGEPSFSFTNPAQMQSGQLPR
jgi:hypothetical protein